MTIFGNLDPEPYDRQYSDAQLARRMARYFAPYWRRLAVVAIGLTITGSLDASFPLLIARAIGTLETPPAALLVGLLVGGLAAAGSVSWLINLVRRRLTTRTIGDVILTLRRDAFQAAMAHDLSFYDVHRSGRVVSRITSDTQEFAQVVTLLTDTASQMIAIVVVGIAMLRIDWRLTLLLLATTPMVLLVGVSFRRLARFVTRQGNRAMANVNASIQETISGIAVAKNFRQEAMVLGEFQDVNRQSYSINMRRGFVLSSVFPVLSIVSGASVGLLSYVGGRAAGLGQISPGAWYLFTQGVDRFFFPFLSLASFWSQLQAGMSAIERVFALIDSEPVVRQVAADPAPPLRGEIEFDRLHFQYSAQETVLTNFGLHIEAGETLALVGHTGAGKSSVAKLVARFYEFQAGALRVDGQDIRRLDLQSYRRQLGVVSQTPFLFAGSVLDNIRYTRPETPEADIEALARHIGQGDWLDALPNGLATPVGERGARLSMGQRQLVALMRVLVQRPAIFILDEATASVDPFTEEQIREALDLILEHSTAIIIAHRLSTVRSADRIVVLQRGRIIEQGSHQKLLTDGGHYAELYHTYFRHQSPDYQPSPPALPV